MEFQQLEASGLKNCVQEIVDRRDMCVVHLCSVCKCIRMLCTCEKQHDRYERVKRRYSTVKMLCGLKCAGDKDVEFET